MYPSLSETLGVRVWVLKVRVSVRVNLRVCVTVRMNVALGLELGLGLEAQGFGLRVWLRSR